MMATHENGRWIGFSGKMPAPISICLIDNKSSRRHQIAKSITRGIYDIFELGSFEEFLNCDLTFSLVIMAQDGNDWHDLRMLCAAANVPVIVLVPDDQWTHMASLRELRVAHDAISVSHMNTDEIIWRIEAFLLRSTGKNQMEMSRKEFTWGDRRFINGAQCVDLVCAYS